MFQNLYEFIWEIKILQVKCAYLMQISFSIETTWWNNNFRSAFSIKHGQVFFCFAFLGMLSVHLFIEVTLLVSRHAAW